MKCPGEIQSPLEASVQELCNARLVEEFAHMDQNGPPIPPSDLLLRSASGRTPVDIGPPTVALTTSDKLVAGERQSRSGPTQLGRDDCTDGLSVAVYYRNGEEVREGFLVALTAMGIAELEQLPEPAEPPIRGATL